MCILSRPGPHDNRGTASPIERLIGRLNGVNKNGNGWSARCPAHDDQRASLSIAEGDDRRALVCCHAGCDVKAICAAVDMTPADLFPTLIPTVRPTSIPATRSDVKGTRPAKIFATSSDAVAQLQRRHGPPSAQWTYQNALGEPVGVMVRWDHQGGKKDIRPVSRHGDTWQIRGMPHPRPLYALPELPAASRIYVCEGEKAADAVRSIGLAATTSAHGSKGATKADWGSLAGKEVVVLPDNDQPGREYAEAVASILVRLKPAPTVKLINLPGLPPRGDFVEWLEAGGTFEKLSELLAATETYAPKRNQKIAKARTSSPSDRPRIVITTDEPTVIDQAIESLGSDTTIFKRGNVLANVMRDEHKSSGIIRPPSAPRIQSLPLATLREHMAGAAKWIKIQKKGDEIEQVAAHPPDWCVKAVAARGKWSAILPIEGIVETPILRPDGTLLTRPGYDPETALLYEPRGTFPTIPAEPTLADAQRARDELLEIVADFPFAHDAHRSGWFAGLLTPLARYSFYGPVPMFVIDANTRGVGKSLAVDAIAMLVSGLPMPRMINPESDDEMRKRITTLALEGERLVLLDNLGNTLGSPSLDAALTATTWKDRILGVNRSTASLPLNATWYATGNNVVFNGDTIRRVVPIRLESNMERPEERQGFRHPDLLRWIREERPRLIAAALTILRAFHVAGRPDQGLASWGSYEAWSDAIRQPLVWVGLGDPADARDELVEQSDRDAGSLRTLLASWHEIAGDEGMTVAEVFRRLDVNSDASRLEPLKWPDLRAAIAEISGKALGHLPSPRSFGMRLTQLRGRVVAGRRIIGKPDRTGATLWRVECAGSAGTADTAGTIPAVTPACTRAHGRAPESGPISPVSPSSPSSTPSATVHNASPDNASGRQRSTLNGSSVSVVEPEATAAPTTRAEAHPSCVAPPGGDESGTDKSLGNGEEW